MIAIHTSGNVWIPSEIITGLQQHVHRHTIDGAHYSLLTYCDCCCVLLVTSTHCVESDSDSVSDVVDQSDGGVGGAGGDWHGARRRGRTHSNSHSHSPSTCGWGPLHGDSRPTNTMCGPDHSQITWWTCNKKLHSVYIHT